MKTLPFLNIGSAALLVGLIISPANAQPTGELKVDINRDANNTALVTEFGYVKWSETSAGGASTGLNAITKTFTPSTGGNVTISFSQTATSQSRGGTGLLTNWFKAGAEGTAKLVSDGLTVAPANLATGGQLQMTLTGLSAGTHTLLTFHNAWDNLSATALGPIDIFVNGVQVVDNLRPTVRAASTTLAATAYLTFSVNGPADVTTILFAADETAPAPVTIRNAMINGFELNTPNATRIANSPLPVDSDEHVNADSGSAPLNWGAALAGNAVSHDVYFGTSKTAVQNATHSSPEYKGNQVTRTYNVSGLNSHLTYYWRIDEIDSVGNATKGTVWYFRTRQLAFPGAEGYGRFARGGRDGKVVHVTSLADYSSGQTPVPGTLRYALEQETGPRTLVFDISGLITLEGRLTINSPYITIAGQTAPGKGITLRKYTMGLSGAKDVILRFVRSRPGNISGTTIDGMGMSGSDHSIMDHCSISWSIDEAFSSRSGKNITLQRTLISESLNAAGHQNYPVGTEHGYAASIGGDIGTFHHNLLAHNYGRNWSLAGGLDATNTFSGRLEITNNVVYNWGARTTDGGAMEVNFVNNYYKPGAGTTLVPYALTINHEDNFSGSQRAYFAGNVMPGYFNEANQTVGRRSIVSSGVPTPAYETFVNAPFFPSSVETQSARDAYKRVLSDVGANRPLDDHDVRILQETLNGTFTYRGSVTNKPGFPDSQNDVGAWENYPQIVRPLNWDSDGDGLPNWWETLKGLNTHSPVGDFSDSNADLDNDGFTNLEDYLNWIAEPNVAVVENGSVQIDLRQLTRGYTNSPLYSVSNAQNGSVTLGGDGKTATFAPAAGFTGLAAFSFSVVDADGSAMNGKVNLQVVSPQSFAAWAAFYGLDATNNDPAADPDGDGVPNQLEFVLGLNPLAPDSKGLPTGGIDQGEFLFRFTHDQTAGAALTIEQSTDLIAWTPLEGSVESSSGTSEILAVRAPLTATKTFLRLSSGGVSTIPVGYLKIALPSNATAALGLMLDDTSAAPTGIGAGKVESFTADTITNSLGAWTANLASAAQPWAVRFTTGAAAGKLFDLSANTETGLTLAGATLTTLGVAVGDKFELVPLDTLETFFGATMLQGGTSASTADVVQLRSGATWIAFYYDTTLGFWRRTSGAAVNSNNTVIRPGSALTILRRGPVLNLTIAGRVLGSAFRMPVNNASTTGLTTGFPMDTTLGGLGLQNLVSGWRAGATTSTADSIGLYNGASWVAYVFNGANWQTPAGVNSNAVNLPAGAALLIQRPGSTPGTNDLVRARPY